MCGNKQQSSQVYNINGYISLQYYQVTFTCTQQVRKSVQRQYAEWKVFHDDAGVDIICGWKGRCFYYHM